MLSKKLILNSFSGTLFYIISIVIAFIMSPVILRALGNRDYGLWELVMSVIGYMGVLDLGIGPAMIRFISLADGKKDHKDLQGTMSTALVFFLVIGSISFIFFLLLAFFPQIIAGTEMRDIANIRTVFLLLGVDALLLFPSQVFITVLMGVQRHYIINVSRAVVTIAQAILLFKLLLLYSDYGLIILALLTPIFTFIQLVLYAGVIWHDKHLPGVSFASASWIKMKELITYGIKSFSMMMASRLQNQSVPLIIANVVGLGHVVYFIMPNRIVEYSRDLAQTIGFPLMPYFSASIGRDGLESVRESWLKSTLALQVVALAAPVYIYFCGEKFLELWIGLEYAVAGQWVLYFLLIGLLFEGLSVNSFRILMANNQHGRGAFIWVVLSIISIPLGVICAYRWGVPGAALGVVFVAVIGHCVMLLMSCTAMKVPLSLYLRETLMKLTIPLGCLALALWLLVKYYPAENYFGLILHVSVAGFIYGMSVYQFVLDATGRKRILKILRFSV